MILGKGESGTAKLEKGVVIKMTHRSYMKKALKNMALALQKAPKGL